MIVRILKRVIDLDLPRRGVRLRLFAGTRKSFLPVPDCAQDWLARVVSSGVP